MADKQPAKKSTDIPRAPFSIPTTEKKWYDLASQNKLLRVTLHHLRTMKSGSKISRKQFVTMRAYWPARLKRGLINKNLRLYGLADVWELANHIVTNSEDFQNYLHILENETSVESMQKSDQHWPHTFMLVKLYQERVLASAKTASAQGPSAQPASAQPAGPKPSRRTSERLKTRASQTVSTITRTFGRSFAAGVFSEGPSGIKMAEGFESSDDDDDDIKECAEDETIVVMALAVLLDALTNLVPLDNKRPSWSSRHVRFNTKFSNGGYISLTDGCLEIDKILRAIVEVKARCRTKELAKILQQETAELVSWIREHGETTAVFNNHRLLVSQDGRHIYVSFAQYKPGYLTYLRVPEWTPKS